MILLVLRFLVFSPKLLADMELELEWERECDWNVVE